jgi:hypothetical protein
LLDEVEPAPKAEPIGYAHNGFHVDEEQRLAPIEEALPPERRQPHKARPDQPQPRNRHHRADPDDTAGYGRHSLRDL